jgi:threonine/homoserine/homoserine lactone efflux protein
MDLLGFGAQVVFTSALGVISPGPLFFANLVYGSKQGIYSGIKMAHGHTIVELPLIIILASGLITFTSITNTNLVSKLISLSGGIVILVFSAVQIEALLKKKKGDHIWMDYGWLAVTAHLISRGTLIFRSKYYPILLLALNAALIYYGIYFIVTGLIVT